MKRREFITLLGGAAATWPLAARAQQRAARPVIGYLYAGSPEGGEAQAAGFRDGLAEAGFVDGRNVTVEYRWGENDRARVPGLVTDLVRRRVAVIAAPGSIAAQAAKTATASIPVVFGTGGDPVELGLVANLNRPGGNVTGFSNFLAKLGAKQIGLLHELLPRASRFAVIQNLGLNSELYVKDVQGAAATFGAQVEPIAARNNLEIDAAVASAAQMRADAFMTSVPALTEDSQLCANQS